MASLSPRTLQLVGVVLLVSSAVFWAVTGRQSVELLSAAMTLITLGAVWTQSQKVESKREEYELPPAPDKKPADQEK
jgi:hypothetical protein